MTTAEQKARNAVMLKALGKQVEPARKLLAKAADYTVSNLAEKLKFALTVGDVEACRRGPRGEVHG